MSVHQTKSGLWFTKWWDSKAGRSRKKYFGHGDAGRLLALEHDREIKRSKGRDPDPPGRSIQNLCAEYHRRHDVAVSTRIQNAYRFRNHIFRLLGELTADRLTTRELDLYVHKRAIKEGVKRATVSSELRLLKAVYSWAASQQPPLVHINPTAGFKVKTAGDEKDVPIPPTVDEIRRILNHAGPYLVRAIKIHWHSGIRPGGELQRLRWEHIDFINKEIRIYSAHKGGPVIRTVPISSALESDLKAWLEEDRLFKPSNPWNLPVVHLDGQSIKSLKRTWKTAKKRAGITRKMRLYDLRHAFASNALRAGADLKSVSELLGHSRPDTTLREYQHVTREQHRQAIELIPDVDRGPSGTILPMRNIKR